ncbi:MAG: tetratricopeptide repeat protein, partial [Planctomycetes bacterium]|nr:tetratricopeptide repeat protein [Planctomycetota bacterium]
TTKSSALRAFLSSSLVLALSWVAVPAMAQDAPGADALFAQGLLVENGRRDPEAAIGIYQRIIDTYPDDEVFRPQAIYRRGLCLKKLGRLDEAAGSFRELLARYPHHEELEGHARLELVETRFEGGRDELRGRREELETELRRLRSALEEAEGLFEELGAELEEALHESTEDHPRVRELRDRREEAERHLEVLRHKFEETVERLRTLERELREAEASRRRAFRERLGELQARMTQAREQLREAVRLWNQADEGRRSEEVPGSEEVARFIEDLGAEVRRLRAETRAELERFLDESRERAEREVDALRSRLRLEGLDPDEVTARAEELARRLQERLEAEEGALWERVQDWIEDEGDDREEGVYHGREDLERVRTHMEETLAELRRHLEEQLPELRQRLEEELEDLRARLRRIEGEREEEETPREAPRRARRVY